MKLTHAIVLAALVSAYTLVTYSRTPNYLRRSEMAELEKFPPLDSAQRGFDTAWGCYCDHCESGDPLAAEAWRAQEAWRSLVTAKDTSKPSTERLGAFQRLRAVLTEEEWAGAEMPQAQVEVSLP